MARVILADEEAIRLKNADLAALRRYRESLEKLGATTNAAADADAETAK